MVQDIVFKDLKTKKKAARMKIVYPASVGVPFADLFRDLFRD